MAKYSFGPMNVYNIDETGISNVQIPQPIIAVKGKKKGGRITCSERGRTVTVICAMSSGGLYIPPMFIYPRKRMSPHLAQDGPLCSIHHCSDNGWTNEDLFDFWLKHFKDHCGASTENPVLLILDNHSSHTSMSAYDYCQDNCLIMLSVPSHTSHRLQPLDVVFYGPLKKAFNTEADLFMRSRSLQAITHYDLAKIFNAAYSRIATVGLLTSGLKATGFYPVNPNIFTDLDFQAADVLLEMSTPAIGTEDDCRGNAAEHHAELELISAQSDDHCPLPGLPTSLTTPVRQGILSNPTISSPAASQIEEFLPFPSTSATSSLKRQSSMKQHSEILTSTPRKVILMEKLQKKLKAQEKKGSIRSKKKLLPSFEPLQEAGMTRKTIRPGVQQKKKELKKKTVKKCGRRTKLSSDESTDDTSSYGTDDLCDNDDMDLDHSESINRDICFICRDSFEADNLTWQCSGCKQFAHILCAMGTPDNNQCELCSQFNPL